MPRRLLKGGPQQNARVGFLPNDQRVRRNASESTTVKSKAPYIAPLKLAGLTQTQVNAAVEAFSGKVLDALHRGQLVERAP